MEKTLTAPLFALRISKRLAAAMRASDVATEASQTFTGLPVKKLTLYHMRSNTPVCCPGRMPAQLNEAKELVLDVAEKINQGIFPATEHEYCPCDFPEHCPYYRQKTETDLENTDILQGMTAEEAVERFVSLQSQIKDLQLQFEETKQMVIDFCQAEGLNRIYGKEHAITYKLLEKTGFTESEVRALLEPHGLWNRVLSLDQSKLNQLVADEETAGEIRERLEALRQVISASPRLWIRRHIIDED